ncbi:helix-turn-helix domain-containing protein [Mesorhizobium sp. SB112]|uniref:AraC-like ligand-binding domain-containing protein n=1 Tax=Mesorhizobium sp. SB112 TaxID=3151853 RepID=UPI003264C4E2
MRFLKPTLITLDLERDAITTTERLALWRDAMGLAGEVHIPDESAFTGTFVSRGFGDMRIMRIKSKTFRFLRTRNMASRIRRDHVIVNLVERGRFTGTLAGRTTVVEPGAVLLSRLASPMDLTMDNTEWLGLLFPRAVFEKHLSWTRSLDARVFAPETAQAILLGGLLRSLDALPDPLPVREATCVMRSGLALVTSCLGGQAPALHARDERAEDPAQSIRRFIAERLADPNLGLDLICREFDISRSRLYRVMGESADIAALIRRMRLRAVHREIAANRSPGTSLTAIGKCWGLLDERNFRRAFVQEFGYPPSTLRRQAKDEAHAGPANLGTIGADLGQWFLGL